MRWQSGRRSDNVEDRRGVTLGRGAVGGGAIIVALMAALLGAPQSLVRSLLGGGGGEVTETESGRVPSASRERGGGLREGRRGQHRRRLGRSAAAGGPTLRAAQARVVHGRRAVCVWGRRRRRGAVLLPPGLAGVPGPGVLRRARPPVRRARRLRAGVRRRARGGAPRAEPARGLASASRASARGCRRRRGTACRSRPSSRRTAWRASGRSTPTAPASSWSPGTSRKGCAPPARSATTGCSARHAVGSSPSLSPTARPSSGCAGSRPACRRAGSPIATRSRPAPCDAPTR